MTGGFLTQHMIAHIVAMNFAAPILYIVLKTLLPNRHWPMFPASRWGVPSPNANGAAVAGWGEAGGRARLVGARFSSNLMLAGATALQLALLWGWHTPALFAAANGSAFLMALMHVSLFLAALCFWAAVFETMRRDEWASLAALLVTSKMFCLLGLLLAFAPRALYASAAFIQSCFPTGVGIGASPPVADQQLAGLVMLTACPLVYVTAAIAIASRMLRRIASEGWTLSARVPD